MIEVTILNAKDAARRQGGGRAMAAGHLSGGIVETQVRNRMASQIRDQMKANGIEAEVSRAGARGIEIDLTDIAATAWKQGYIAWMIAKVVPSSFEYRIASDMRDRLEEQGIDAEVDVV
jgi:hypothetical protein